MRVTSVSHVALSFMAAAALGLAAANAQSAPGGMLYTMNNAVSGNQVMAYTRAPNGVLTWAGSFATGGMGTGAGLGSEGSLTLSHDQNWIFAVNGGSNDVSVFSVAANGLTLTDTVATGGTTPVSVTSHRGLVYVVHSGSDNIAGFRLSPDGKLTPVPGSMQSLSGTGVGPAQISFDPDGDMLVVTEKNTNLITTFRIGGGGAAMPGQSMTSSGMTPYGFAFSPRNQLFISEAFGGAANASAVSSYRVDQSDALRLVAGSVKNDQSAACWTVTDGGGRFVYVSNTGSNTLSSYVVEFNGQLALLQSQAAQTGAAPTDMATSSNGRFIYTLGGGDGSITGDKVLADGILVGFNAGVTGLPTSTVGLAGW
ncbi:MAG TPA: beta-propeller fold lactonase family protein [Bryobacteraceae bacterium]|nr:beta-propeller fold lactonase family protein [Bryobacteraceae bacterium]